MKRTLRQLRYSISAKDVVIVLLTAVVVLLLVVGDEKQHSSTELRRILRERGAL